jgi:hypothetical protein
MRRAESGKALEERPHRVDEERQYNAIMISDIERMLQGVLGGRRVTEPAARNGLEQE